MLKTNSTLFMLSLLFSLSLYIEDTRADSEITDGLNYLNQLRSSANMTLFSSNALLDDSAFNHSNYLMVNNTSGHYETETESDTFTGYYPFERAAYVGYKGISTVSENIFSGDVDIYTSIDQLFSAIYHRFGFLSFDKNEVGIGVASSDDYDYTSSFVYNMGNMDITLLCDGSSQNSGYKGWCLDPDFIIKLDDYLAAQNISRAANPELVVWPYDGQQDTIPVFFEESPDPLPECSVSGYPASIQFNEHYTSNIEMISFKLYNSEDSEITNTEILTQATDPLNLAYPESLPGFTAYQFALFPMDRLEWDSNYVAEFIYTEGDVEKEKIWGFKTKKTTYPSYTIEANNQILTVVSGNPYTFYAPPQDCNDTLISFHHSTTNTDSLHVDFIEYNDLNSIDIQVSGSIGDELTVDLSNGISFVLKISNTDTAPGGISFNPAVSAIINSYLLL